MAGKPHKKKLCPVCNQMISIHSYESHMQHTHPVKQCTHCGKQFTAKVKHTSTCSKSCAMRGRDYMTPEFKQAVSRTLKKHYQTHHNVRKGVVATQEFKRKVSAGTKRYWASDEGVKMRKHLGEVRSQLFSGDGNPMHGKHHTPAAKQRISEKSKQSKQLNENTSNE
jgi:hypothetical protein